MARAVNARGSSPLTRGKHGSAIPALRRGRLIPAHAGKTRAADDAAQSDGAHPRSRGENDDLVNRADHARGSSPLTRGKLADQPRPTPPPRLIPAHAGKTRNGVSPASHAWAHPRSRGENAWLRGCVRGERGSSPLTRGKPASPKRAPLSVGLIPAHAGKTACRVVPEPAKGAHPRSRGENHSLSPANMRVSGSSPLTRGKRKRRKRPRNPLRLIPAHAGKTPGGAAPPTLGRAHPRSRGENVSSDNVTNESAGSSPLTRGKPPATSTILTGTGLIPAHAGKTSYARSWRSRQRAHPRSRGENTNAPKAKKPLCKAHPRSRGENP